MTEMRGQAEMRGHYVVGFIMLWVFAYLLQVFFFKIPFTLSFSLYLIPMIHEI